MPPFERSSPRGIGQAFEGDLSDGAQQSCRVGFLGVNAQALRKGFHDQRREKGVLAQLRSRDPVKAKVLVCHLHNGSKASDRVDLAHPDAGECLLNRGIFRSDAIDGAVRDADDPGGQGRVAFEQSRNVGHVHIRVSGHLSETGEYLRGGRHRLHDVHQRFAWDWAGDHWVLGLACEERDPRTGTRG